MGWKYNPFTGELDFFEEGGTSGDIRIGTPDDGTYDDGLLNFSPTDKLPNAIDAINEILKYLAPAPPQDLSGTLTLSVTQKAGYIAAHPNDGGLAGNYFSSIVATATMTGSTPDPTVKFAHADEGELKLYKDATELDSFDLAGHFNEAEREGCQSYPPANSPNGYITVTLVCWHNNFPAYQRGNARVNFSSAIVDVGLNQFVLSHEIGAASNSASKAFYYDDGPAPTIEAFDVTLNSEQTKFLSGVKYYTTDTSWDVSIAANGVFDKTYVAQPASITCQAINTINLDWNATGTSGFSNPPNWDDPWYYSGTITFNKAAAGIDIIFGLTVRDPWSSVTASTTKYKNLYNTYGNESTDTFENFTDEIYRLPPGDYDSVPASITGQWDSTQPLTDGNAQVFCDKLVYPTLDFSDGTWRPVQNAGTNYSTFSGDQLYFRAMRDLSTPHNSGSLSIEGITWDRVGSDVELYLKLPGQTGWLDLGRDYNAATFSGADGDGCMTGYSQSGDVLTINWSSGYFSTAGSGYMYVLKIVLKNAGVEIKSLQENF